MKVILSAFARSLLESVDSKRALAAVGGAIASSLVLLAGQQHWTWLDQATADKIAGVIVLKGFALIGAYTFRDGTGTPTPASPTVTLAAGAVTGAPSKN